MVARTEELRTRQPLVKAPTGVVGLHQVRKGGPPRGWATLLRRPAGSGKKVPAMEFLDSRRGKRKDRAEEGRIHKSGEAPSMGPRWAPGPLATAAGREGR